MFIKKIIPLGNDQVYTNATKKDNEYYLLNSNNSSLSIHDMDGRKVREEVLPQKYVGLTYNNNLRSYFMIDGFMSTACDQLSEQYELFNRLWLQKIPNRKRSILDIFYDLAANRYLILTNCFGYSIDAEGNYLKNEIVPFDFYIISDKFNPGGFRLREIPTVPHDFSFTAIGSVDGKKWVAYQKGNNAFLSEVSENGSLIENHFIADHASVLSILDDHGLSLLVRTNDGNFIYQMGDNACSTTDTLEKTLSLLDTVYHTEMEIASLIHSESSKINKLLDISNDPQEILEGNRTVLPVIQNLQQMEQTTFSNLNTILNAVIQLEQILHK